MTRLGVAAALVPATAPFHLVGQSRVFYTSGSLDEPPRRVSGPPVDYPPGPAAAASSGLVRVAAIIDTTGRAEPASWRFLSTPDSGLIEPVKQRCWPPSSPPAASGRRPCA